MKALPRVDRAILAVALLVGAFLRADRLSLAELTTDEAFSWRLSTYPPAEIVARTATDVHPPLYYIALAAWTSVWGDSPVALRGLSMILGLAAVGLAYQLGREVDRHGGREGGGAAAAAVLVAVHADQVSHSRHARMYAMGAVLAGLSAWMMLRALRSERRALAWWAAYAVTAAALCYTHYYGAFSVAAQILFAGVVLARRGRASGRRRGDVLGLAVAALGVTVLYAPWLPVLWRQTTRVSDDYWIRDVGPWDIAAALMRWMTGLEWAPSLPVLVIALFAAAAVWALWRGDAGQRFLALQAVVPWLGALLLSWLAGRTLFLERYLFLSQLALLVGLARAWSGLRAAWPKRAIVAALGSVVGLGLAHEVGERPTVPPAAQEGARMLAGSVRPADLVCASSPRDLNVLRYYLLREGATAVRLQCPASRAVGHLSQVASITPGEILPDEDVWSASWGKVWRVRVNPPRKWRPEPPPPDWTLVFTRVFEGPASTRLLVTAYERAASPRP
jgi:dolichyl-phosphate-mannose-protein mannosyltransferase